MSYAPFYLILLPFLVVCPLPPLNITATQPTTEAEV